MDIFILVAAKLELEKVMEENKDLKLEIEELRKKISDSNIAIPDLDTENNATGKNMFCFKNIRFA